MGYREGHTFATSIIEYPDCLAAVERINDRRLKAGLGSLVLHPRSASSGDREGVDIDEGLPYFLTVGVEGNDLEDADFADFVGELADGLEQLRVARQGGYHDRQLLPPHTQLDKDFVEWRDVLG